MKINKIAIALNILSTVAFVFVAVATGGNTWVQQKLQTKDGTIVMKRGLWKSCSADNCVSFTVTSGYLIACRALSIIACLFSFAALVLSHLHASKLKPYLFPVASIVSVVTMFIGVIVYISKNIWISSVNTSYGWTFYMTWLAITLNLTTCVFAMFVAKLQRLCDADIEG